MTLRGTFTPRAGLVRVRRSETASSRIAASTPNARITVVAPRFALRSDTHCCTSVCRTSLTATADHRGATCTRQAISTGRKAEGLRWERFRALRPLWPQVADELAGWPGTVIVDLGRLHSGDPVMPLARASTAVLALTTATLEGLYHVRDQVAELSRSLGDPCRDRPSVAVVVTGDVRDRRSSLEQVRQVLASIGSPAPVVGFVADDPAGARGLWAGELTRRFAGSELVRSVRATAQSVLATWPDLTPATPTVPAAAGDGAAPANGDANATAGQVQTTAGPAMEGARS